MERKKKEDDQKQDGWLNLVTSSMGAWLEDLELGGRDKLSCRKSIYWLKRLDSNLMGYSLSIN